MVRQAMDESGLVTKPSITRPGKSMHQCRMPAGPTPAVIRKRSSNRKNELHWVANSNNEALMNLRVSAEGERYSLERRWHGKASTSAMPS